MPKLSAVRAPPMILILRSLCFSPASDSAQEIGRGAKRNPMALMKRFRFLSLSFASRGADAASWTSTSGDGGEGGSTAVAGERKSMEAVQDANKRPNKTSGWSPPVPLNK
mmetsp:Transcript_151702/g.486759  ORF Transcript_151702/g.486759 Transcript_151702/m.486759 type:complete len:110 (+) Transcript_151702:750-1079(+)